MCGLGATGTARLFQFTPLREGRLHGVRRERFRGDYFNSRPSARGDPRVRRDSEDFAISIHAPPRGATKCQLYVCQHIYFNSRPSARGDQSLPNHVGRAGHISIHAPPRGATSLPRIRTVWKPFQFTPLREGRRPCRRVGRRCRLFQFTPLREGRQQKICNFCKSFVQPLQISMA